MPEFVLRYKVPDDFDLDWQVAEIRRQAVEIAEAVKAAASKTFYGWDVSFEVRPFDYANGQPDFAVTGWVTEREDVTLALVLQAQAAVQAAMQDCVFEDQRAEAWWQLVRGKWGGGAGKKVRPTEKTFFP